MSVRLPTLKTRAEFLRVAAARTSAARPGVVVQAAPRREPEPGVRAGYTASKRVGNAVIRNRAKRRLRAAAAALLPERGKPGTDYVLIARVGTGARPYGELLADLDGAIRQLARGPRQRAPGGGA